MKPHTLEDKWHCVTVSHFIYTSINCAKVLITLVNILCPILLAKSSLPHTTEKVSV